MSDMYREPYLSDLASRSDDSEFYQEHLNHVSRSFALCIAELESPLREWVSMTYLLCRWLDTIEDAAWQSKDLQAKAFSEFVTFFEEQLTLEPNTQSTLGRTCTSAVLGLNNVTDAEKKLIEDSAILIAKYSLFPERVREIIACLVIDMASGMSHFANAGARLGTLNELNQYCFFVAGIVGEALTDLLDEAACIRMPTSTGAHHFGLFLQKINVLKDQFKDEAESRYFVADRDEVIESLLGDAKSALEYIITVPVEQRGYRTFCAWSYFLGLATLPLLAAQTSEELEPKLDRESVTGLFNLIRTSIDSNEQLLRLYFNLTDQIKNFTSALRGTNESAKPTLPDESAPVDPLTPDIVVPDQHFGKLRLVHSDAFVLPEWLLAAYGGRLKADQLKSLGL